MRNGSKPSEPSPTLLLRRALATALGATALDTAECAAPVDASADRATPIDASADCATAFKAAGDAVARLLRGGGTCTWRMDRPRVQSVAGGRLPRARHGIRREPCRRSQQSVLLQGGFRVPSDARGVGGSNELCKRVRQRCLSRVLLPRRAAQCPATSAALCARKLRQARCGGHARKAHTRFDQERPKLQRHR